MKIFVGVCVAGVVLILGMYLLPIVVPVAIDWTTNAKSAGILQPSTFTTLLTAFWPLILGGVVVAIGIAVIIWSSRGSGGGFQQ